MKKSLPPLYTLCLLFLLCYSPIEAQEQKESLNNTAATSPNFHTSQSQSQNSFDGLGYYKLNSYNLNYTANKFNFTLGAGLLEQNTIFNNSSPGLYGNFSTNLEYKINHRYTFYLFGRYLSPSLNGVKRMSTPHMLHIFPQTEVRAGLRGNFNNMNVDIGAGPIFGNDINQKAQTPVINSKISIGF